MMIVDAKGMIIMGRHQPGKHDGRNIPSAPKNGEGWLGGRHRKTDGCAGVALMMVGSAVGMVGGFIYLVVDVARSVM